MGIELSDAEVAKQLEINRVTESNKEASESIREIKAERQEALDELAED